MSEEATPTQGPVSAMLRACMALRYHLQSASIDPDGAALTLQLRSRQDVIKLEAALRSDPDIVRYGPDFIGFYDMIRTRCAGIEVRAEAKPILREPVELYVFSTHAHARHAGFDGPRMQNHALPQAVAWVVDGGDPFSIRGHKYARVYVTDEARRWAHGKHDHMRRLDEALANARAMLRVEPKAWVEF